MGFCCQERGSLHVYKQTSPTVDSSHAAGQVLQIAIPAGVSSGQTLSVTVPDGQQLNFTVPPGVAGGYLHRAVRGRVPGILHQCCLPEDDEMVRMIFSQACRYASHCSSRKVVLLYYLGPSKAVASLCPRGDANKIYEVRIEEDTVLVYLNDACELYLQELGPGRIFEVNLMLQTKQSQQQAPKDSAGLSVPMLSEVQNKQWS
eukprot:s1049_g16.t1